MIFDYTLVGLTKRDIQIYEALFTAQDASLRGIAEMTGINRGTVHESIKAMTKLGLVSYFEIGKQRRYVAQDPTAITSLIQERKQQLNDAELQARSYISQLQQQAKDVPQQSFATFYEGDDGVAVILRDVLSTVRSLSTQKYEVISSKFVRDYLYNNFPNFTRQRIKQNIFVRVIAIGEGGAVTEHSNRKWLKAHAGTAPNCYTIIYGEKTAFISLDERNIPQGIVMNNAGLTALQRTMFEQLWSTL